jgi:hypothetical protein
MRLDSVTADPTAAWQGNQFDFDIANNILDLQLCNSTHLRFEPVLPAAIVSGPVATLYGWEWMLANGWVFGVGDAQGTKIEGLLDNFGLAGMQIYFIVPVADIPLNGDFKIERLREMDGTWGNYQFSDQGECPVGSERLELWDHSLAGYFADKRNVNSADPNGRAMCGKFIHEPPPLAYPFKVTGPLTAGTMANRAKAGGGSETRGRWGLLADGKEKVFDAATVHGNMGDGTHVAFAATLGYSSEGATAASFNDLWVGTAVEVDSSGIMESIDAYWKSNNAGLQDTRGALWNCTGTAANMTGITTAVEISAINRFSGGGGGATGLVSWPVTSALPSVGSLVFPCWKTDFAAWVGYLLDTGITGSQVKRNTIAEDPTVEPQDDDITGESLELWLDNAAISVWVTYTPGGGGGGAGVLAGLGVGRIGGMMGG